MTRATRHPVLRLLVALGLLLGLPGAVVADGEATGIVVTPPRVKPGDEILILGFALWTELEVDATLVSKSGATRALGDGATGPDGTLNLTLRLPGDVPAGQYSVVVTNIHGETAQAPLVIEDSIPVVPLAVLGGALAVALAVGWSAAQRRRLN